MTSRSRLEKLERARQAQTAALNVWIENLSDGDLECICRDTARSIRCGELQGEELAEYCRLSDTPDLAAWLESVETPQPGDTERLARLMATAPEPWKTPTS